MAFADDLRSFLENRLEAFDPTIDLSSGSSAQVKIIDPTIDRFGEDPFSVDISSFLRDRLVQEFPELAADGAGLLEDLFTNPMRLLLEPFKRNIETTRINQSAENADLMNDAEADALGANFFLDREEGEFASGQVRVYFSAPTTTRITTDREVTSRTGNSYFPTESTFITSQQMIFNRDGNLFFVDITVRADQPGSEFNVDAGDIINIDDVEGVVRVTNLAPFNNGLARQDNEEYLGSLPQALTERSLVTKRGLAVRTSGDFGGSIAAIQVVGAGEEGMDRDVLTGTGEGFLHLVGNCSLFGSWIFMGDLLYLDDGPDNDVTVQIGDTIRFQLPVSQDPDRVAHERTITDIISTDVGLATEKHIFILDSEITTVIGNSGAGVCSVFKAGFITISGIPGGIAQDIQVPSDQVHLGGHTDVLVRPASDAQREGVLPNLTDDSPLLALLDVGTTAGTNLLSSSSDFVANNVEPGDVIVLETGASAGSYTILSVGSPDANTELRIDAVLDYTESSLRARVIKDIRVDLVEPKVPKIPFQPGPVSDLQTTVGSTLFRTLSTDIQSFGAAVGDTIRVLDGDNAGDYTITGFDGVLGGQGPIVDRAAPATGAGQRYEVFTAAQGLEFPLVRIREIEVLDSTNQGTGVNVPYGDAVDVRPLCALEGAGESVRVLDKQLIVAPDGSSLWGLDGSSLTEVFASAVSSTDDARYSQQIESADGRVRTATSGGSNPITTTEINIPPFAYNGRRDTIIVLPSRENPDFTAYTPPAGESNRTSDVAEARIGDSIVISDGPNQGSYTIQDLRVFEMWSQTANGHRKIAVVQLDQELPVNPLDTIIDFIDDVGAAASVTAEELVEIYEDITRFETSDFWLNTIIGRLETTLNSQGFTFTTAQVTELVEGLVLSGYEVGESARGTFRVLFKEPVSVDFNFGSDPTFFRATTDDSLLYRLDPDLDDAQILPQSETPTGPKDWNRDFSLENTPGTDTGFLVSGSSFAKRGIRDGDTFEFHRAINDLPSRRNMLSSWMFVTTAGSNEVRAIFPGGTDSDRPDNLTELEPGHLFFIDSGPDTGAYLITEVVNTDVATGDPIDARFKIDQVLTHSTAVYPSAAQRDFVSQVHAVVSTSGNAGFPMALSGLDLQITFESQGFGATNYVHTFGAGPFNDISDIVSDINGDGAFVGTRIEAVADGDELVLRSLLNNVPRESITILPASTAIGGANLQFTGNQSDGSRLGAVGVSGTKKIYGTGLASFSVGNSISIYAANNDTILSEGEDEAYLGTFSIVAAGTESGGPRDSFDFVELDRSANFPADVELRWLGHAIPSVTPSNTSGGGKELATSYVRGRLYGEVSEEATITIPWLTASVSPILGVDDTADPEQVELSVSPVSGLENFSHRMPYRVVRSNVKRISSTAMEQNRLGALYYVDLPVIGVGVLSELNIDESVGLLMEGNVSVEGYILEVQDPIFTYSEQEQVSIILPRSVLPVGSTPDEDNKISLAGQNLQVNYDSAPAVSELQQFYNSPLDRITTANILVRHFLPTYVYLDVTYVGGNTEATVAQQIINFINSIDPDLNELASDDIAKIIRDQGALQVRQPINIIALTHGTDRRIRGTQSEDVIGGDNLPTFAGNFKQTFFIPGPDTSTEDVRPNGEQVFLVRL